MLSYSKLVADEKIMKKLAHVEVETQNFASVLPYFQTIISHLYLFKNVHYYDRIKLNVLRNRACGWKVQKNG